MKVKELFKSRTKNDIKEIGKIILEENPNHFEDLESSVGTFLIFLNECQKCETKKIDQKTARHAIIILNNFDLPVSKEDIIYKDAEETEIDYDRLKNGDSVLAVDVINLLLHYDTLKKTAKELQKEGLERFSTTQIDFVPREKILNTEIADLCFDRMSKNEIAAKIYWEMTYYGLYNDFMEKRFGIFIKNEDEDNDEAYDEESDEEVDEESNNSEDENDDVEEKEEINEEEEEEDNEKEVKEDVKEDDDEEKEEEDTEEDDDEEKEEEDSEEDDDEKEGIEKNEKTDDEKEESKEEEEKDNDDDDDDDDDDDEVVNPDQFIKISFDELEALYKKRLAEANGTPEARKLEQDKEKVREYRYRVRDDLLIWYIKKYETTQIEEILREYTYIYVKNSLKKLHDKEIDKLLKTCNDTQLKVIFKDAIDYKTKEFHENLYNNQSWKNIALKDSEVTKEKEVRKKMEALDLHDILNTKTLS